MRRVAYVGLGSLVWLVSNISLLGCSGVSDPGTTIGNPGIQPEAGGADQTPGTTDDATVADTGMPGTGTTPDAGGNTEDATVVIDAAPEAAPPDTGRIVDEAGPEAGPDAGATFACGANASCTYGTETCCLAVAGGGGQINATCVTGLTCPGGSTAALHCVATADCPVAGNECCLTQGGMMGGAPVSNCRGQCLNNQVQLCDPAATNPGCPALTPTCMRPVAGGVAVRLPANVGTCQ